MTISKLFSFKGRIPRSSYWIKNINISILYLIFGIFLRVFIGDNSDKMKGPFPVIIFSLVIFSFICAYISLATDVKRCHDRGRSGWFLLLGMVPLLNIWLFIELGFLRGGVGDNHYGPDPLAQR